MAAGTTIAISITKMKIEDGRSRIEDRAIFDPLSSILDPFCSVSILHPPSSTFILMMLMAIVMPAAMFGVAEDQRLDNHWNRLGVGQLLADIDKVKVF